MIIIGGIYPIAYGGWLLVLLPHVVVLEKVVIVGVLDSSSSTHAKVSPRGVVVSLVSLLVKTLHYVRVLQSIV